MSDAMIVELNNVLSGLKIEAECVTARKHRHMSFYDLVLRPRCRVRDIEALAVEIALAIKSRMIPIIKPVTEKGVVQIQSAHRPADVIDFHELYAAAERPAGGLPFLLGETTEGNPLWVDMAKNPHLLLAGGTGSGKSVLLHVLIANASKRKDVELYLTDTKAVEFSSYNNHGIRPLVQGLTVTYSKTVEMFEHLHKHMNYRYDYMSKCGVSNVDAIPGIFNKILVVVDEAADLMLCDQKKRLEKLVVGLAQKSRAAGIYLVLATQRPSVDVITGLVKANFPARVACRVPSRTDSITVLDSAGAELLIGRGDAIIKNYNNDGTRFQSAFVRPEDTVNYYLSR